MDYVPLHWIELIEAKYEINNYVDFVVKAVFEDLTYLHAHFEQPFFKRSLDDNTVYKPVIEVFQEFFDYRADPKNFKDEDDCWYLVDSHLHGQYYTSLYHSS